MSIDANDTHNPTNTLAPTLQTAPETHVVPTKDVLVRPHTNAYQNDAEGVHRRSGVVEEAQQAFDRAAQSFAQASASYFSRPTPTSLSPNRPRIGTPQPTGVGVTSLAASEALTRREREVLGLMVQGLTSDRELAEHLLVSPNTIKYHLKNLFSKLGVSSRAQLIARAASIGQR